MKQTGCAKEGVVLKSVTKQSPFFTAGLRSGDLVFAINGEMVSDELDFRFFTATDLFTVHARRRGVAFDTEVERAQGAFLGVELAEQPIKRCTNHCVFCFIDQMPKGLRHGLYIKDEDFRYSFLNGNYVTLSGASVDDLENVARIGLSPLYVSVHATDTALRNRMLGNKKAPPIMEQLRFLRDEGIWFHTQIVVCPGYNDGPALTKTVRDLLSLGESVCSIAVVPVGLTRFRRTPLPEMTMQNARKICAYAQKVGGRNFLRDGARKLFVADEFFIKAQLPIPDTAYYEDYPQIGNGVGLLRQLLDEWQEYKQQLQTKKRRKRKIAPTTRLVVTSDSAYCYITTILDEYAQVRPGETDFIVIAVKNSYFGETVTVAGLLTAYDVLRMVKETLKQGPVDTVVLPAVMFNYAGFTLDGYSAQRMEKSIGTPVRIAQSVKDIVGDENK